MLLERGYQLILGQLLTQITPITVDPLAVQFTPLSILRC